MRSLITCLILSVLCVGIVSAETPSGGSVSSVVGQGNYGEYTITYPDTITLDENMTVNLTLNVHTVPNTTLPYQYWFRIHQIIGVNSRAGILDDHPLASVVGEHNFSYTTSLDYNDNVPLGQWGFLFAVFAVVDGPNGERFLKEMDVSVPNYVLGDHDLNRDSSLNIADITYLIKYIFSAGPKPKPSKVNADINCDQSVNIADITKLISYIFGAGSTSLPCFAGTG